MQYADSHSHRRPGVWQATDCLVACESGAFVISSPNMAVIPEPHVGTADVHWEADGYFGCHDPARWPQLFDQDDSYRWMTAVRMRPSSASDAMAPMWRALVVEGVDADVQCVPGADLYTVCAAILEPLARLVKQATARVCAFKDARGKSSMLHDLEEHMTFALRSLSYPSSKRDLVRGLADLQRHWLLLDAWLEWHVHLFDNGEKAYQDPHHKRQDTAIARSDLLGAFTTDTSFAHKLFTRKIPVWLVRTSAHITDTTVVKAVLPPSTLRRYRSRGLGLFEPRPVYSGPPGPSRITAIIRHGLTVIDRLQLAPTPSAPLNTCQEPTPGTSTLGMEQTGECTSLCEQCSIVTRYLQTVPCSPLPRP